MYCGLAVVPNSSKQLDNFLHRGWHCGSQYNNRLLSSDYTLNIDILIILDDTGEQDKFHWPKFGLMDEKGEDG